MGLTFVHGRELIVQFKAVMGSTTVNMQTEDRKDMLCTSSSVPPRQCHNAGKQASSQTLLSHGPSPDVSQFTPLTVLQPHSSLCIPVNDHTPLLAMLTASIVCCNAPLCTHISLVLLSSLAGELGSKWESSGGSSFPCASSQALSSRSFLLLARSAVGRDEKPFSTPCPHLAGKQRVGAPAALKNSSEMVLFFQQNQQQHRSR